MGWIRGICISRERGTQKYPVDQINVIEDWGLEGDAHAGRWHRQVSLLALEKIQEFQARGALVEPGAFGENVIVEGYDLKQLPVGTRFRTQGGCLLELTQIGKQCHSRCNIYQLVGDCIMPREGVFTRVLEGGTMRVGDWIETVSGSCQNDE